MKRITTALIIATAMAANFACADAGYYFGGGAGLANYKSDSSLSTGNKNKLAYNVHAGVEWKALSDLAIGTEVGYVNVTGENGVSGLPKTKLDNKAINWLLTTRYRVWDDVSVFFKGGISRGEWSVTAPTGTKTNGYFTRGTATAGVGYAFDENWSINGSYTHVYNEPHLYVGAYLIGMDYRF